VAKPSKTILMQLVFRTTAETSGLASMYYIFSGVCPGTGCVPWVGLDTQLSAHYWAQLGAVSTEFMSLSYRQKLSQATFFYFLLVYLPDYISLVITTDSRKQKSINDLLRTRLSPPLSPLFC
jgi:hypothetical protein